MSGFVRRTKKGRIASLEEVVKRLLHQSVTMVGSLSGDSIGRNHGEGLPEELSWKRVRNLIGKIPWRQLDNQVTGQYISRA